MRAFFIKSATYTFHMIDLKTINAVLGEFEDRGISRTTMIDAVESAMATAYKREYGKHGQIVRAKLDLDTGTISFEQIKTVVDDTTVRFPTPDEKAEEEHISPYHPHGGWSGDHVEHSLTEGELPRFDSEKHILLENAKLIKRGVSVGEEIIFPLEPQDDFGRIAAQTAKQVVIQKVREAEKLSMMEEFSEKKGQIVSGIVQRMERGAIFVDLGRTTGIIPYEEQIPGERYRMGERIRAYLYAVDEGFHGVYLRLSRAHPKFVVKLFEMEAPELAAGSIEVKALAREPGSRTKIALASLDPHVDPVGSLVGRRGVRVSTVMSELGGERIDIIEWNDDAKEFVKEALSPATPLEVVLDEADHRATVTVTEDEQSLAIGRGGQNVRLAAKLTGWNIDIISAGGTEVAESDGETVAVASEENPAEAIGIMPTESNEIVTEEISQMAILPAEEELTELPASDETIADKEEDRDTVKDDV
ncbi:transcription termination/antitermination protein NusA [Candidatus Kaiserbacteria bacterium CG08_land_8_20_14_0_20_50_21]|uniref:Transcription termination/antitermination protein NusA n=1 Tax=Candidatus Kaiserbacteria bacterium CG08_land_8_20_14_0_20_50_21 TaxID=1974604 RepID=A0A2H0YXE2_9BACT|nr:MAG: transcription termination/antitermination protein NusA [Candidatus Kaiserbacteria bacterium CG08_land_8_20_14_0_20_50_21]